MRIGLDVGGTHTDGVLVKQGRVLRKLKRPTSPDVVSGVAQLLRELVPEAPVTVFLGTTQFTNAVLERRGLTPTAAVRLCLPAGQGLPPFIDWPEDLVQRLQGRFRLVAGGYECDGRLIAALDPAEIERAGHELAGARALAVSGIFAPLEPAQELQAAALLRERFAHVTCSHELGRLGLLERENAALLNACLAELAGRVVGELEALVEHPLWISQNDGTVARAARARRYPVLTFASGPTNSLRGAAHLAGVQDAVVIDVGGTSADVGLVRAGFPREAPLEVRLAGVRTNFRMPDLISLPLGGGTVVHRDRLGPESVGRALTSEGRVFGGETTTLTDLAVAAGRVVLGDPARVRGLDASPLHEVRRRLEQAVEAVRTGPETLPVLAVGGGSFLVPDDLAGASCVLRPAHYEVANAVGAALGQVSGEADWTVAGAALEQARERILSAARERAVEAGADPASLAPVDREETPLAYLPGNVVRLRARVVGSFVEHR